MTGLDQGAAGSPFAPGDDVPVAVPGASSSTTKNHLVSDESDGLRPANTLQSAFASSSRLGRRGLDGLRSSLSARDWAVLGSVAEHRYLTTKHVMGLHFADHASQSTASSVTRRVLRRLSSLRILSHLERRVGGVRAGSASYVWRVGPVGSRLLRGEAATPRRWQYEPGSKFLGHCLAIADAHLALVMTDRTAQLQLLTVQLEPTCWRTFTGLGGGRLVLQPDLYIVTGAGQFEDHWFLEIDRGTESLNTLLGKCQQYEAYRRSGIEQAEGGGFPLVTWVLPDGQRADRLRQAVARVQGLNPDFFRMTTYDAFVGLIAGGAA
ncbi:MAG: replication-relaxation family protein [Acidothermales bacterium]|nr:replication-relaxation family protein [Acidothermales bacterium]